MVETGVAGPCTSRGHRINLLEIADYLLHRSMQAVEIQPVETGLATMLRSTASIVGPQPLDEVTDGGVAPHPRRETLESAQRLFRCCVGALPAHVPVHPVGVRPVRLGGHRAEPLLLDQPFGDLGSGPIELLGSV